MYLNNKDKERQSGWENNTQEIVEPKKIGKEYIRRINTKINVILLGEDKVNIIMDKKMYGHAQRKDH